MCDLWYQLEKKFSEERREKGINSHNNETKLQGRKWDLLAYITATFGMGLLIIAMMTGV